MVVSTTKMPVRREPSETTTAGMAARGALQKKRQRQLSDDEILGLITTVLQPATPVGSDDEGDVPTDNAGANGDGVSGNILAQGGSAASGNRNDNGADGTEEATTNEAAMPPELAMPADANPQLRQALADAQAYRTVFASPGAAQDAKNQLDDLDRMFFSGQPSDHAALAARMHELSPEAFQSFAKVVQAHAAKVGASAEPSPSDATAESSAGAGNAVSSPPKPQQLALFPSRESDPQNASSEPSQIDEQISHPSNAAPPAQSAAASQNDPRRAAQVAFFHDTNATAVEQILGIIQAQVNQLLPESVPSGTRNRIIGEVYRELDSTLRANRQLGKQLREAFQAGAGDAAHQRAIVTLVAGRAKQALPSVAKRVIGEWTQHIVAANHERLSRHKAASKRVDIAGAGASDGVNRKPLSARDVNYKRLSDADILNL